jgi:hypothetical protein
LSGGHYYFGGGGGGCGNGNYIGNGGLGGGAAGSGNNPGNSGSANTGGGAGANYNHANSSIVGGTGGSGIVIIRTADTAATATTVGAANGNAPYITGGYKYYKFTGTGNITF